MNSHALLKLANTSMLLSLLSFISCVILAYGYEDYFGLISLTMLHVSQIVLAGLCKLSYVVRLVALDNLGLALK
jgi:hypothetical protein